MTAIIIPRRHYTQPQGRVEIDPLSPFARGLEFAMVGPSRFVFSHGALREVTVVGAQPRVRAGLYGWGFGAYGTGSSDRISVAVSDFAQQEVTSFALALFNSPANGRLWDGGSIYAQCGADAGRNTTGGLQYVNPPSTTYDAVSLTTVALPIVGTHGRFHRGFEVSASGGSGGGGTPNSLSTLVIGNRAAADRGLNGIVFMQAHWSRLLSAEEVYELHQNPFQLFRADPLRIYSLPSGPITLNSLTMSNITQTTARATLSLTR